MISWSNIENKAQEQIRKSWKTLGLPLSGESLDELQAGLIDPESLVVLTLLIFPNARFSIDVVAWMNKHSSLINNQKLKTLIALTPDNKRKEITLNLKEEIWFSCESLQSFFLITKKSKESENILNRMKKLAPLSEIAKNNLFLKNRLLFGTGFRADLISLLETQPLSGSIAALLLSTSHSTISRILADLRECAFLDKKNRVATLLKHLPKNFFISADTLRNTLLWMEAKQFKSEVLVQQQLEEIDTEFDIFTKKLFHEIQN